MNKQYGRLNAALKGIFTGLALSAMVLANSSTATAANPVYTTAANASIINKITVTYKDTANASYSQSTQVTVTVLLLKTALTVSTLADITVNAGTAAVYTDYAITSNANGSDGYKITETFSGMSNLSAETLDFAIYRWNGSALAITDTGTQITTATGTSTLTPVNIGATTMIAWDGVNKISVPFGSLNGITTNTIVMVGAKGPFVVTGTTTGTAPAGPGVEATPATITIAQYAGGALPTTVVAGDIGNTVREQVYLRVTVNGTIVASGTGTVDGFITHTLGTTDSANGNPTTQANTTTFRGTKLTISKQVRNCTATGVTCGSYGASGSGLPGDVLEYQVTVVNSGSGPANLVAVADAVPNYTLLVDYSVPTTLATVGTQQFAKLGDGTTNNIALNANGTGGAAGVGYGKVTYATDPSLENNPMNFYLGAGSTNAAGGTLTATAPPTYTINYKVRVR